MRSLTLTSAALILQVASVTPAIAAADTCQKIRRIATSAVVDGFSSESAGAFKDSEDGKYHQCRTILAGISDPETCVIIMDHAPSWNVSWELSKETDASSEAKATANEISACLPSSQVEVSATKRHWRIFWPVANGIARLRIDASVAHDPAPQVNLTIDKK